MSDLRRTQSWLWPALIVTLFVAFSAYQIGRPPTDLHQFRQTQTLSTIYNFYVSGVDLLRPEIDTNGSKSVVILEFPLYQAIVAAIMRYFGYAEAFGRVLNIVGMAIASVSLFYWISRSYGQKSAIISLCILLLTPETIFWSSAIIIDPFAVAIAIVAMVCLFLWLERERRLFLVAGIALASIAVSIKLTAAFIPLGIFFTFALMDVVVARRWRRLAELCATGVSIAIAFAAWYAYSYWNNVQNPHQYTNSSVVWYLGTSAQRLSLRIWAHMGDRLLVNSLAALGLVGAVLTIFAGGRAARLAAIAFAVSILYFAIFINLNFVHTYYQFPFAVANAIAGGLGLGFLAEKLTRRWAGQLLTVGVVLASCVGSYRVLDSGWLDTSQITSPYQTSSCELQIGQQIRSKFESVDVRPRLVGVVFEHAPECWNGPHALMYYMRGRGYVVDTIGDGLLEREPLDMLLVIDRQKTVVRREGWTLVSDLSLNGDVRDYDVSVLVPGAWEPSGSKSVTAEPSGSALVRADTPYRLQGKAPPFSEVTLAFKAAGKMRDGAVAYVDLMTPDRRESQRQIRIAGDPTEYRMVFHTGATAALDWEFGARGEGQFEIQGPVEISYKPLLN